LRGVASRVEPDRGGIKKRCRSKGSGSAKYICGPVRLLGGSGFNYPVFDQPSLDLAAVDVGQHLTVDLDAGREGLTAFLHHFGVNFWIVNDVLVLVLEIVLGEGLTHAIAPAADGFQIGDNIRGDLKKDINISIEKTLENGKEKVTVIVNANGNVLKEDIEEELDRVFKENNINKDDSNINIDINIKS
jgi:hypothetical protein